jgi:iron complex outermembrane receptor protein
MVSPQPYLLIPLNVDNLMNAETYGLELATDLQVASWWMVRPSYSYFKMKLTRDANSTDAVSGPTMDNSPENQFYLRSSMNLPENLQLDLGYRYIDKLPNIYIGSYSSLDARLGWRVGGRFEVAVVGQNLLEKEHAEFVPEGFLQTAPAVIERSVYLGLTANF